MNRSRLVVKTFASTAGRLDGNWRSRKNLDEHSLYRSGASVTLHTSTGTNDRKHDESKEYTEMTNKRDAAVAEPELDEEEEKAKSKMGMPIELYAKVEETAKAREISVRALIREVMAEHVGYEGPLQAPRARADTDGLTPEEVKAKRQERNKERRQVFSALLAKYGGNLDRIAALLEEDEGDEDDDEGEDDEEE